MKMWLHYLPMMPNLANPSAKWMMHVRTKGILTSFCGPKVDSENLSQNLPGLSQIKKSSGVFLGELKINNYSSSNTFFLITQAAIRNIYESKHCHPEHCMLSSLYIARCTMVDPRISVQFLPHCHHQRKLKKICSIPE